MLEAVFFHGHKDDKKDSFPPPPPSHHHYHNASSGQGVLGVQKKGAGRGRSGCSGELGLEEGGSDEDDDPDI